MPGRSRGHARSAGSNIFSKKEVRAKGGRKIGGRGETNGGQGASEKILFKGVVIWVGEYGLSEKNLKLDGRVAVTKMTLELLDWSLRQHNPAYIPALRRSKSREILLDAAFRAQ